MEKEKSGKTLGKVKIIIIAAVSVIVLAMFIMVMLQGVHVSMDNAGIKVSGGIFYCADISYSEISDVSLISSIEYGTRTNGYSSGLYKLGNFRNSKYGRYKLFIHSEVSSYIEVRYGDGEIVVFNCKDEDETKDVYHKLTAERLLARTK